jgi:hypothetical protein
MCFSISSLRSLSIGQWRRIHNELHCPVLVDRSNCIVSHDNYHERFLRRIVRGIASGHVIAGMN